MFLAGDCGRSGQICKITNDVWQRWHTGDASSAFPAAPIQRRQDLPRLLNPCPVPIPPAGKPGIKPGIN